MKIINNFLEKETHQKIKELLLGNEFPWHYQNAVGSPTDYSDFFFCHTLYKHNKQQSEFFNFVLMPILGKLQFTYLIRAKINCYTKNEKEIKTEFHLDQELPHTVCIYTVNNSNGYTLFENGDKYHSVENSVVIFDGLIKHCSIGQTDENIRVNVNINLQ
jgi:hypothetical protein